MFHRFSIARNRDCRGRQLVPESIKDNEFPQKWSSPYTTEFTKRLVGAFNSIVPDEHKDKTISPAQFEYVMNSLLDGMYGRIASDVDNAGDISRAKDDWRNLPGINSFKARPQANRLIGDFYDFYESARRKTNSGIISLEDFGKYSSMEPVKEALSEDFNEMHKIRSDKSLSLADQDWRIIEIGERANHRIRDFNAHDDYRQRGIAYAASHLTGSTLESLDENTREQYTALLTGVPKNEIVQALIRFGNETVMVKQKGVPTPHRRWSSKNINERVGRLLMLMQGRD